MRTVFALNGSDSFFVLAREKRGLATNCINATQPSQRCTPLSGTSQVEATRASCQVLTDIPRYCTLLSTTVSNSCPVTLTPIISNIHTHVYKLIEILYRPQFTPIYAKIQCTHAQ